MRGAASDPRVDVAMALAVRRSGARAGCLISEAGMLAGMVGAGEGMDVDAFVSLAAGQAAAARALAPLVCGREFSELLQEGPTATVHIVDVGSEWVLASLHDLARGEDPREAFSGEHVASLKKAMHAMAAPGDSPAPGPRVGSAWSDDAETRIDRIFRGED